MVFLSMSWTRTQMRRVAQTIIDLPWGRIRSRFNMRNHVGDDLFEASLAKRFKSRLASLPFGHGRFLALRSHFKGFVNSLLGLVYSFTCFS